ncbi:hypothetical protein FACS1894113_3910 [Alphaproteobacteria bacterium]|nr:hypothetical protein FACS1894113_3910 [Alphaproteobacteria bacterium]
MKCLVFSLCCCVVVGARCKSKVDFSLEVFGGGSFDIYKIKVDKDKLSAEESALMDLIKKLDGNKEKYEKITEDRYAKDIRDLCVKISTLVARKINELLSTEEQKAAFRELAPFTDGWLHRTGSLWALLYHAQSLGFGGVITSFIMLLGSYKSDIKRCDSNWYVKDVTKEKLPDDFFVEYLNECVNDWGPWLIRDILGKASESDTLTWLDYQENPDLFRSKDPAFVSSVVTELDKHKKYFDDSDKLLQCKHSYSNVLNTAFGQDAKEEFNENPKLRSVFYDGHNALPADTALKNLKKFKSERFDESVLSKCASKKATGGHAGVAIETRLHFADAWHAGTRLSAAANFGSKATLKQDGNTLCQLQNPFSFDLVATLGKQITQILELQVFGGFGLNCYKIDKSGIYDYFHMNNVADKMLQIVNECFHEDKLSSSKSKEVAKKKNLHKLSPIFGLKTRILFTNGLFCSVCLTHLLKHKICSNTVSAKHSSTKISIGFGKVFG